MSISKGGHPGLASSLSVAWTEVDCPGAASRGAHQRGSATLCSLGLVRPHWEGPFPGTAWSNSFLGAFFNVKYCSVLVGQSWSGWQISGLWIVLGILWGFAFTGMHLIFRKYRATVSFLNIPAFFSGRYLTLTLICGITSYQSQRGSPGWCGSVDWVPACKPKSHWFDSQSGNLPGLQTRSPDEGLREATVYLSRSEGQIGH